MQHSLYLHPKDHQAITGTSLLLECLEQTQFIGKLWRQPHYYLAGDRLLQLLSFAGCSPFLDFSPSENGGSDFCFVQIHGPYAAPWGFASRMRHIPRCPNCGHKVRDWETLFPEQGPVSEDRHWLCPDCKATTAVDQLRWRNQAAFGRCLVEIHKVFPGEAVPTDQLLGKLGKTTGIEWQYGWAESSRLPAEP